MVRMYIVGFGLLFLASLWLLRGQRSSIRRNGKRLPRPPGTLPLVGSGLWFLQPRHKLLDWFSQCERQLGFRTFEISVPSLPPGIVISSPENIEHVLKNNDIFVKGAFFKLRSWDLFGNGIINADGDLWRIQRKAGLRFFSNSQLKSFIDDVLPPLLQNTKDALDEAGKNSNLVDMQEVFLGLTTRLMGSVAYDMDIPGSLPFSKAFDFASGVIGERFQNPFWKLKEIFFGGPLRKAVSEVKQFGRKIVANAVQHRQAKTNSQNLPKADESKAPRSNLIDSLLDHLDDHEIIADAAMNYLSAGRDTTAQSLTWTLYLLLRNSSCIPNLLSELREKTASSARDLPLSYSTVQPGSLPYIAATFNESLRLYPPVPVEIKECTMATTFPDGTWLPKGAIVMWAPWAMGRSRHIWGQDADIFRPERWIDSRTNQMMVKSAFEFPVFNGGPRACLGKKMAELLAVYVIAALIWEYEFKEVHDQNLDSERRSQNSLTLPMEGGLPVMVARRQLPDDGN